MGDRPSFQCLAPARQLRGGGVVLTALAWSSFAIIFGTFVALNARSSSCADACYDPSFCWSSNVTSTAKSTVCYGEATACFENCAPTTPKSFEIDNATSTTTNSTTSYDDDGSYCREANRCDELAREESEKVNECYSAACAGVSSTSTLQNVMTMLGLLLILLSGTLCLNFYSEAVVCPPKCSPAKEAIGRVVLYGSIAGAVGLMILVAVQLVDLGMHGAPNDGWYDLAMVVVFIYVIGINGILVLCACGGRCLLSADVERELSIVDDVEGRAEEQAEEPNAQVY
jgi:hypothetical protein